MPPARAAGALGRGFRDLFPLSVNYPVQVFFERKTGQAPLGAGYRGSIIWGREPFGPRGVSARRPNYCVIVGGSAGIASGVGEYSAIHCSRVSCAGASMT